MSILSFSILIPAFISIILFSLNVREVFITMRFLDRGHYSAMAMAMANRMRMPQ